MAGGLQLRIITPERVALDERVDEVSGRAIDGSFAVLPHHEPLITALAVDLLTYKKGGAEHSAALLGGLLEVGEDASGNDPGARVVTVLTDLVELDTEMDVAKAHAAKLQEEAKKTTKTDKLDAYVAEVALGKAMQLVKVAELSKHRRRGGHNINQ
ncbi:MAG TPA: hypothetical protein V6C81_03600 [Planktothrix sp.]|jgi:F-type H+-transporting ATPase subunit epsilon